MKILRGCVLGVHSEDKYSRAINTIILIVAQYRSFMIASMHQVYKTAFKS